MDVKRGFDIKEGVVMRDERRGEGCDIFWDYYRGFLVFLKAHSPAPQGSLGCSMPPPRARCLCTDVARLPSRSSLDILIIETRANSSAVPLNITRV